MPKKKNKFPTAEWKPVVLPPDDYATLYIDGLKRLVQEALDKSPRAQELAIQDMVVFRFEDGLLLAHQSKGKVFSAVAVNPEQALTLANAAMKLVTGPASPG